MDGRQLENVSKFEYFRVVLSEPGTDGVECFRKIINEMNVADAIWSLVSAKGLRLDRKNLLHEDLSVLT